MESVDFQAGVLICDLNTAVVIMGHSDTSNFWSRTQRHSSSTKREFPAVPFYMPNPIHLPTNQIEQYQIPHRPPLVASKHLATKAVL